jgi:hypothetical protein
MDNCGWTKHCDCRDLIATERLREASQMADRAHAIAKTLPGWTYDSPVERLNLELQCLTAALHAWTRTGGSHD